MYRDDEIWVKYLDLNKCSSPIFHILNTSAVVQVLKLLNRKELTSLLPCLAACAANFQAPSLAAASLGAPSGSFLGVQQEPHKTTAI